VEGRVKWFNEKKGYGFIETETHGDVFVHYSNIDSSGFRTLKELDRVTLDVETSPKGPQAVKVKVIEE
jgi:cold shock protein